MGSPIGFEIRDANRNLIAFCLDEATAQVFAHVPELLGVLELLKEDMPNSAKTMAIRLLKKLGL